MTQKLSIPDKWLAGYIAGHPGSTVADAVAAWQEQERMEREARMVQRIKANIRRRLNNMDLPPLSPYKPEGDK